MSYSNLNYLIHQFTIAIGLRKALSDDYKVYLDVTLQGKKGQTTKQLCMMAAMKLFMGE